MMTERLFNVVSDVVGGLYWQSFLLLALMMAEPVPQLASPVLAVVPLELGERPWTVPQLSGLRVFGQSSVLRGCRRALSQSPRKTQMPQQA